MFMLNIRYKVTDLAFIGCDHTPVIPDWIDFNNMLIIYDIYSFDCSMLILKYDNMQPLLRLLLLLFFLNLQAPMKTAALVTTQGTTYSAYQAQSNFELLENDSRYISYQGECVFSKGLSGGRSVTMFHFRHQRNAVNCQAINQVGKHSENWVDREVYFIYK